MFETVGMDFIQKLVEKYNLNYYKKKHYIQCLLKDLICMAIYGMDSVQDMHTAFIRNFLLRSGCGHGDKVISRAQISRDVNDMNFEFIRECFRTLVIKAKDIGMFKKLKYIDIFKKFTEETFIQGKQIYALDSTFKPLNPHTYPKAGYGHSVLSRKIEDGLKPHVAFNLNAMIPIGLNVTPGNVHDSKEFENLVNFVLQFAKAEDTISLMDKAYYGHERFEILCDRRIWFVTPRKNLSLAKTKVTFLGKVELEGCVIEECKVKLSKMKHHLRRIVVKDDSGTFELLTNIWLCNPLMIVALYSERWIVEVFFRCIKQEFGLKTKRPIGKTLTAVMTQIYCAFMSYIVLQIYRFILDGGMSLLHLKRLLKYSLQPDCSYCPLKSQVPPHPPPSNLSFFSFGGEFL